MRIRFFSRLSINASIISYARIPGNDQLGFNSWQKQSFRQNERILTMTSSDELEL